MKPITREDIEKIKNDDDRQKALLQAGIQFIYACTAGTLKSSQFKRDTVARRMSIDVSNFSKWKPAFDDELPIERPKADQVVSITYGADSDEPAKWLAHFCGGLFIKLPNQGAQKILDQISASKIIDSVGDTLKSFASIIADGKIDFKDREKAEELWGLAFKVAETVVELAFDVREKAFEEKVG